MTEKEKAMKHDREMEEKFRGLNLTDKCIDLASEYLGVSKDSTYIVMFAFVLSGYKALCSSSELPEDHGHYVEVVYNDHKDEFYIVSYEETGRKTVDLKGKK